MLRRAVRHPDGSEPSPRPVPVRDPVAAAEGGAGICATFSIVGRDPRTGEVGIAVSTAVPGVGAIVPHACRHGAIATQSYTNIDLGLKGQELLALGLPIGEAIETLLRQDRGREVRQVHGIDAEGRTFTFIGQRGVPWCGHLAGANHTVAGNMLVGRATIRTMSESFRRSARSGLDLAERLLRALESGQRAGGDKRGKVSAALLVWSPRPRYTHNCRVDAHADPVAELRRVFEATKAHMPRRLRTARQSGAPVRVKL